MNEAPAPAPSAAPTAAQPGPVPEPMRTATATPITAEVTTQAVAPFTARAAAIALAPAVSLPPAPAPEVFFEPAAPSWEDYVAAAPVEASAVSEPLRITAHSGPLPLHDTAGARAVEQWALARQPPHLLMQRAGLALARLITALAPRAQRVQFWCGPGNNGGDGLVAARLLHQAGWAVQVLLVGHGVEDEPALQRVHEPVLVPPTDAALALAQAQAAGLPLLAFGGQDSPSANAATPGADVLVDALLGLGASRPPAGDLLAALQRINAFHQAGGCVVAVDLPSGLHAGTGQALGALAATASHTLALLTLKPGLFTGAGRELAGEIWFDDLGVSLRSALHEEPAARPAAWLAGPTPGAGRGSVAGPGRMPASNPSNRRKAHDSHKGAQGQVLVLGGAPGMEGAAQLAARAALAAGAGRVHLCLLDEAGALLAGDATAWDPTRPELLHPSATMLNQGALLREAIVLCGCGAGPGVGTLLNELLQRANWLVLDADALNTIATRTGLASLLRTRRQRGLRSVITPHPLEAARLLGSTTAVVQANRLAAAAALARDLQCTVVLKGSGTVVAEPGEPLSINPSGNAALATAGTGDVLAGWLAGLWAQQPAGHAVAIARQAVWQHGYAADEHNAAGHQGPLLAADLVQALAAG
jgi:ADP-dependent NAD(P)H-hydrate dehydratase / NAD(P)H-hydrate epimerase